MLYVKASPKNDLVIRGARVVDPARGVDAVLDVRVDDGVIAQLGADVEANGHRVVDAAGRVLAPAFVDPHVHLRTPGREDEESIASGTQAAATGGFCAILAMPNTEPVVDSAAVLGALVERAQAEAEVRVGFLAAISKGSEGGELTEMGELADSGAVGLPDNGRPVVSSCRSCVERSSTARSPGGRSRVHCEEARSRVRPDARGRGVGPARIRRLSVRGRERHGRPGRGACRLRRPSCCTCSTSRLGNRSRPFRRAQADGVAATAEVTPHHLVLTDEAMRSLDPNVKMNPPLRSADDRQALIGSLEGRDDLRSRNGSRAARPPREGRAVRGGSVRRYEGLGTAFSALYTHLVEPGILPLATLLERMSAGPARAYGLENLPPASSRAQRRTSSCSARRGSWRVTEDGFRSRSANSWLLRA